MLALGLAVTVLRNPAGARRLDVGPLALLLGLDLGPNLAFTGSLSAWLWLQASRGAGSRASLLTYTRLGAVVAPLTLAAALAIR